LRLGLLLEAAAQVGEEGAGEQLDLGPNLLGVEGRSREEARERRWLRGGERRQRGVDVLRGLPGGGGEVRGRGEEATRVGVAQLLQRSLALLCGCRGGDRLVQVHRHCVKGADGGGDRDREGEAGTREVFFLLGFWKKRRACFESYERRRKNT
jgi:hypothetical protein